MGREHTRRWWTKGKATPRWGWSQGDVVSMRVVEKEWRTDIPGLLPPSWRCGRMRRKTHECPFPTVPKNEMRHTGGRGGLQCPTAIPSERGRTTLGFPSPPSSLACSADCILVALFGLPETIHTVSPQGRLRLTSRRKTRRSSQRRRGSVRGLSASHEYRVGHD